LHQFEDFAAMTADPLQLDRLDRKLLQELQRNGRASNVELSALVHLSAPQCLRRVRQLEEARVIRRYAALVDAEAIGLGVTAFVAITIEREQGKRAREIERDINSMPEIIECYTISGDYDYLLKVVARDLKALSEFLTDRLMQLPGVASTRSSICMENIKPVSPMPTDLS
jgi:Lrp/AsnC family transcriptional regulator, leucine-responsive regulatory protein